MKTSNVKTNWKTPKAVLLIFLVFIFVLFCQYCYISLFPVVYGINMQEFAANRNTYSKTLYAKRGNVYDTKGNVLAQNVTSYTVIAYLSASRTTNDKYPNHVVDKEMTAAKLSPILGMSQEYILKLLSTPDVYQVELGPGGRGITELKKDEIKELYLPGIDFMESSKRYYPNGDFASYTIGYAKEKEEYVEKDGKTVLVKSIEGELGIEAKYNEELKGTNGYIKYQQDRFGYRIPETKEEHIDALDGNEIYLTIDSNVQRFVEGAVKDAYNQYSPEWMILEVMDAKTGDILASTASPSFDPNIRDITNYENPLVSFVYEPGSTMKTFTYMCAIDKGTYRGDETYKSGRIAVGDGQVTDWLVSGFGDITFDLGFEYSSNVAITNIVQKFITKNELKECFNKYGFGLKSGIELPRELEGTLNFNYPIEVASAGFGQGISITPIQMLKGLTIIANNGKALQPHIISKIVDPNTDKVIYEREVTESAQIVSEATVKKMRDLMWNTVNNNNTYTTATGFRIDGYDIIGKTGSAQIYDNQLGEYTSATNDQIFSFAGMFPYDDPQVIIYIAAKKPNSGSATLLKGAFKSVVKNISKYYNIYDENIDEDVLSSHVLDSYINGSVKEIKEQLEEKKLNVYVIGSGERIINQYPSSGSMLIEGDKVFLLSNASDYVVPDFTLWTRIEAISYLNLIDMKYGFSGYGCIKKQSIEANSMFSQEEPINFELEQKYLLDGT